ncbi:MAG: dihydropteroate synthase [Solirubrobacteraceae bacterium]
MFINCKGNLIDLNEPKISGILNITPDSFFDGGRYNGIEQALFRVEKMLKEGADFIDIGASSTNPKSIIISEDEELQRIVPVLERIIKEFPETIISIDTFYAKVAKETIYAGAAFINDVSAGTVDEQMFETIAQLNVPYVLSHIKAPFSKRFDEYNYDNVTTEINYFFSERIFKLNELQVNDIILDPGFGFSKNSKQNFFVLKNLDLLKIHELPILAGLSRKSMLYKTLNILPAEALNATSAVHMVALQNGANILRVHDVKEAVEVITIFNQLKNA